MTSPNYNTLLDDATELADRLMHARDETVGTAENNPLVMAAGHAHTLLERLQEAKNTSTRERTDGIIARVTHGKATKADTQHIRKALENFYD